MKTSTHKMTILVIIILLFTLTGCQKDLFDPNGGSRAPIISNVPENFDWSTTSSLNLSVIVDDQYNGQYYYTIEVFDYNPITSKNAILLSKGFAKKGSPFITTFSAAKSVKSLAIRQTDPRGVSIVRVFDVSSSTINCDFSSNSNTIATRSLNRSIEKSITFDNADFPTTIPTGTLTYNGSPSPNTSYVIPNGYSGNINLQNASNVTLYINGEANISHIYLTANSKLYILPNSTVTTNSNDFGQAGIIISLNTGATLNTTSIAASSNAKILNKGTINAGIIRLSTNSVLYSTGSINLTGKLSGENEGVQIVNEGTVNAAEFELAGSSRMDNSGDVTIANKTAITSTAAVWRHLSGTFKTTNMDIQGSNPNSINACQLIVTNLLRVFSATFKVDAGAYVTCKDFYIDNARIEIRAKGFINVSGIATYNYNAGNNGIYGTGADYALYKVNRVVASSPYQNDIMRYGGKIQIESVEHVNKNIDDWNIRFREDNTVQWVAAGASSISIDQSGCNPGNNTTIGVTPTDPTFPLEVKMGSIYTYAMEDSWPNYGDYDMNDIVVTSSYSYLINSNNKVVTMLIDATLRSVGASKTLGAAIQLDKVLSSKIKSVKYDAGQIDGSLFTLNATNTENGQTQAVIPLFDNAHKFISNGDFSGGKLINTIIANTKYPEKTAHITITFTEGSVTPSDIDVKNINYFIVNDSKKDNRTEIHLAGYKPTDKVNNALFGTGVDKSNNGIAYRSKDNLTWGLMIPTKFDYPAEFNNIKDTYTTFGSWAQSGGIDNVLWYKSRNDNYIYK